MMRQLRPFYTPEELREVYKKPYNHTHWESHKIRVAVTIHIARWLRDHVKAVSAMDLSCGDGAILQGLNLHRSQCFYGDLVSSVRLDAVGLIEGTVISAPRSDLFILSETLEHLESPGYTLGCIRDRHRSLILSTPVDEDNDDNPEHYWGWNSEDVRKLLIMEGFNPISLTLLDPHIAGGYTYQIWACT